MLNIEEFLKSAGMSDEQVRATILRLVEQGMLRQAPDRSGTLEERLERLEKTLRSLQQRLQQPEIEVSIYVEGDDAEFLRKIEGHAERLVADLGYGQPLDALVS